MVTAPTKDEFRAEANALRALHANDEPASFVKTLSTLDCFTRGAAVALYIPFGVEPETADIIARCHQLDKRLGVPAWDPQTKQYGLCAVLPDCRFAPGRMGIPEPERKAWTPVSQYDLVLIPGLLFDGYGTRLGHGKGYYDRMLADRTPHTTLIGLAFDWQVTVQTLPRNAHDVPMDLLVTPTRVIKPGAIQLC